MSASESKASFFRQGGWMVIATVGSGVFMTAVQSIAAKLPEGEYGAFFSLLRCIMLLGIPTGAIQTVLAQQAASSYTPERGQQFSRLVRGIFGATFCVWLVLGCFVALRLDWLKSLLQVKSSEAIVFTLFAVLTTLLLPVVRGVLQGKQHFFGMGFVAIIDGVGRFSVVLFVVVLLHGGAASALFGALLGQIGALALGLWLTRKVWMGAGAAFDWKSWLKTVLPLTFGAGSLLVLQTADGIFVQSVFPQSTKEYYIPAAIVGFALVQFTIPLALVMYPKIVRSEATSESSNALWLTFAFTAGLGFLAAVASTILPTLPLKILYFTKPNLWVADQLVPWFAWCMFIFTLANVLVNNLLARERFAIVPWVVAVAVGFCLVLAGLKSQLMAMPDHFAAFKVIVKTLSGFNTALLLIAVWYTWRMGSRTSPASSSVAQNPAAE